jgi:hypothetical protein
MIYLPAKFKNPASVVQLLTAIKPKAENRFHATAVLLFAFTFGQCVTQSEYPVHMVCKGKIKLPL